MSETKQHVIYYVIDSQKNRKHNLLGNVRQLFPNEEIVPENQKTAVRTYIETNGGISSIIETHIEIADNRKTNKWPQLQAAIKTCKSNNAVLIIAELATLTTNESFSATLLEANINFHCCDQPFINHTILEALCKHAQVHKKRHGELIKQGLKLTSAKSGNPNAAKIISEVNKPKIDTAIIFAHLLQPIIRDYKQAGFSQRQMVKSLNEEGFTAPEGGRWVLSQLQKVLDRVRLNEITEELKNEIVNYKKDNLSTLEIAEKLNSNGTPALKKGNWDETQVKKLITRIEQIDEINNINKFIIDLLPVLHEFRRRNFSVVEMLSQFEKAGIPINPNGTNAKVATAAC